MPTLQEFWDRQEGRTRRGLCADCGMRAQGRRCWDCGLTAKRKPLGNCRDCGAPMHRRTTPVDERAQGSRFFGSVGRCNLCDRRHRDNGPRRRACRDCGKTAFGERCRQCAGAHRALMRKLNPKPEKTRGRAPKVPAPSLAERYPVPTPADDASPLTKEELRQAVCAQVDTEMFFADLGEGYHEAKSICAGCPIAARCLAANLHEEYGVWGCSSPPERKAMRREAKKRAEQERAAEWVDGMSA